MGISIPIVTLIIVCCVIAITLYILHMLSCGVSLILTRPEFTFLFGDLHVLTDTTYVLSLEFINAGSIDIAGFNITLIDTLTRNVVLQVGPVYFNRSLGPGVSVSCKFYININSKYPINVTCSIPVNAHNMRYSISGNVVSGRAYVVVVHVYAANGLVVSHELTLLAHG